ncbi:MAG: hypothetical protein AB7R77_12800, partial [Ilumatobacteraceae bacterium]
MLRKVFDSHLPAGFRSRAARFDITTTEGYRLSDRKMAGRRKANKRSWRKYQAEARVEQPSLFTTPTDSATPTMKPSQPSIPDIKPRTPVVSFDREQF